MFIYSEVINLWLNRMRPKLEKIVTELNKDYKFGSKHIDLPILVAFEDSKLLGFYDSVGHRGQPVIALNRKLIYAAKDHVSEQILLHELAHHIVTTLFGNKAQDHGAGFRDVCKRIGCEEQYAETDIEESNDKIEGELPTEELISKIKKLLALSSSNNVHESNLAMMKANQLLLKHNLTLSTGNNEMIYNAVALDIKRNTAKYSTISAILREFNVYVVYCNKGQNQGYHMEITGSKASVEIAEYVAKFLDKELDRLWEEARKDNSFLRGVVARNSFFDGLRKGYLGKIKESKTELTENETTALIKIDQQIEELAKKVVYKRLCSMGGYRRMSNSGAYDAGKEAGSRLSINTCVTNNTSAIRLLK